MALAIASAISPASTARRSATRTRSRPASRKRRSQRGRAARARPFLYLARVDFLVSGGLDAGAFDHQDDRAPERDGPMRQPLGHGDCLAGPQPDALVLELDRQLAVDHIEELVLVAVLVLVVLALDHTQSDHGLVDTAQGFVVPGIRNFSRDRRNVHPFQRTEPGLEDGGVLVLRWHGRSASQ